MRVFSEEHRKKLSLSHMGKKSFWEGKKRPEASKWLNSPEAIAKRSASLKGKPAPWVSERQKGTKSTWVSERNKRDNPKRLGELHPGWIKDRTQLKKQHRNDTGYAEWRKQVYARDKFKCKIDNGDCEGRMEAHHILGWSSYPELRYEVNNGITLCHAHHPLKRSEEKRLAPLFQELVLIQ